MFTLIFQDCLVLPFLVANRAKLWKICSAIKATIQLRSQIHMVAASIWLGTLVAVSGPESILTLDSRFWQHNVTLPNLDDATMLRTLQKYDSCVLCQTHILHHKMTWTRSQYDSKLWIFVSVVRLTLLWCCTHLCSQFTAVHSVARPALEALKTSPRNRSLSLLSSPQP